MNQNDGHESLQHLKNEVNKEDEYSCSTVVSDIPNENVCRFGNNIAFKNPAFDQFADYDLKITSIQW